MSSKHFLSVPENPWQSASFVGANIREEGQQVTYSYYGVARGKWERHSVAGAENVRDCWGEGTGDVFLNPDVSLRHVPPRVWEYRLGGYPVIRKWLGYRDSKRRLGQPLTLQEFEHLRSMVHRIAALLVLHQELDKAYEKTICNIWSAEELKVR